MASHLLLHPVSDIRKAPLKEHAPGDLGRVLGLDRAPEVKTLRHKLERLAGAGRAVDFGQALAQKRIADRRAAMGFLYVDGHVRVCHGVRTLPKANVARMRLSTPAATDYRVNDTAGDPLFVVTAEANAGLTKMLPIVLREVRGLVGERRVTMVFDRGGYSPKLFVKLIADGFDILTYRQGRVRRVAHSHFSDQEAVLDGRKVRYTLADRGVRMLSGRLRLRQVTRLAEDGHQTHVLTCRREIPAIEVAFRMFDGWTKENFFKHLSEEYALDALADYGVVAADPAREVPNPKRDELTAKLEAVHAEIDGLTVEYGVEAFLNPGQMRLTMPGSKVAQSKPAESMRKAFDRISRLERVRAAQPKRVPVASVITDDVVKLAPERKLLTNIIKMVAYQTEGDLVELVAAHYKRAADEGRTLILSALAATANLQATEGELHVTLEPLSSPHRSKAIAALCEDLNRNPAMLPGTRLRLHFAADLGHPGKQGTVQ